MTKPKPQSDTSDSPTGMKLHMGIAEQGKLYALQGRHKMALQYYRVAMQMTVQAGDPEVFFRHYLECVIESLEQTESYPEVLEYCDRVIQHYELNPPPNPMATMDLAHTYQRKGVNLFKSGDREGAILALQEALKIAGSVGQISAKTIPLAQTLLQWLRSNLHIDDYRLLSEQHRQGYFSVRKDTVDASIAVKLPDESLAAEF